MRIATQPRNLIQNNSGAALVEFSLLIPVIFFTVMIMTEFTRAIYQHHVAEKGVKNAARYLTRIVDKTGCALSSSEFSTASGEAKTMAQYGSFSTAGAPTLSNWGNPSDITITIDCEPSAGWRGENDLPLITVSTSFDYNDIGLLSLIGRESLTIQASHQEVFIGG